MAFEKLSLRRHKGPSALGALAACMDATITGSLVNVWGSVSELTASHVRIAGLSKFTKLGDWISIETEFGSQIAEAIRIDSDSILVRPLEEQHRAAIGAKARITQALELCPHEFLEGPRHRCAGPSGGWRTSPRQRLASLVARPRAPLSISS